MKEIVVIELFAGIGGFVKGLIDAGFKIKEHYFSEIDKHTIANYKYNFPNAKYIGSVTDISGRDFTGIDIITFGSPCQDFSLAGKREGMDGKRSVLILEAIRLVTELRPPVFIWENVKGAFSSNAGADFWGILQAFANIGGYRLEWQLLNTKWFLPQNRERIYLVGHLAGRSKPGVFPIGKSNEIGNEGGKIKEKIYNVAQTLMAGDFKSQRGNFVKVHNRLPRSSITGKGGTGILTKNNEVFCLNTVNVNAIEDCDKLRNLTEIECERLQGFPDNWTEYGDYEGTVKKIPKTQRYKMLGNAVTVRVVEEIAKRIELL